MAEYTLYLDESETANVNKITNIRENETFVIAGLICKNDYHDTILNDRVNAIKNRIWNRNNNDDKYCDKILHELEMSRAIKHQFKDLKCEYNKIFKNKHIYNFTYDMVADIISSEEIIIMAVCIDNDNLNKQYDMSKLNDRFQIAMNMIIENYYHFLNNVEGTGIICYESLPENQNEQIRKRYQGIKYYGTMFYPAKAINKRIKGLEFKNKKDNIVGLQLADFLPNAIGRHILNKTYSNKKERNIPFYVIDTRLYDGFVGIRRSLESKSYHKHY